MSGVFGVVAPGHDLNVRALANRMAIAMSHREWFEADHFVDPARNLAIGRMGIGIFNPASQPVWNSDRSLALVMAGEIYRIDGNGAARSETLRLRSGQACAERWDELAALRLYERLGDDFASRLNGAFVIAIWDAAGNRLVIANDRFGLYPLFYACRAGRLIFAPEMKGILCDETFPRRPDWTALAETMRFQHLLGERTFFEDIQLLPCASVLTYDLSTASCRIQSYWTFRDIPYRPGVRLQEAVEESGRLLRRSVERLSGDAYRPGVYLSGGLDSRTVLGLVKRRPIVSLTYGARNCRDVHYAGQTARAAGSDHHWFDLPDGSWVREWAEFHLDLTEGLHSWIHAHGISTLPQARRLIDVNLTGWDGATVMGHSDSIEPLQVSAVDDAALVTRLFYLFNQKYTWPSITEAEESLLYCEGIRTKLRGLAFDSFRAELSRYLDDRTDARGEYFYLRNHCRRLTQNMITFTRSHVEVRFPFFDYDLFDFLYSLPSSVRGHQTLYRSVLQREAPRLAAIPYDHDELPPTTRRLTRSAHALKSKFARRFNRHVWPVFPERQTLYADYEAYLRGELREWAESILFDRRMLDRGIFDPKFVRSIVSRHMSGREAWTIGKIAPLMTYELMLRRFFD